MRCRRTGILVGLWCLAWSVLPAAGSSHREAPLISSDPTADNTDVYAFLAPDAPHAVTLIANFVPAQEPGAGPLFYQFDDDVQYDIHVDHDGDCQPDVTYRFDFTTQVNTPLTPLYAIGTISELTSSFRTFFQMYSVTRIVDGTETVLGTNLPTPPVNLGPVTTPDYAQLASQAVFDVGGTKVFCGPRDDPFYADLGSIFDLLSIRPGAPGDMGGGVDGLSGYNVMTIALQIPIAELTLDGSVPTDAADPAAVVGVWSSASRHERSELVAAGQPPVLSGPMVQVSRLGMPLVNEVVIPRSEKDAFNGAPPLQDGQFLSYVTHPELAGLLNAIHGLAVPDPPRDDLVRVFLTGVPGLNQPPNVAPCDELRLNVAIGPAASEDPLGVLAGDTAGFPNGRRPVDDVVDIALRVMAGVLVPGFDMSPSNRLGDGVDQNDLPALPTFPYLPTPHQSTFHMHHRQEPMDPVPTLLSFFQGETSAEGVRLTWSVASLGETTGFRLERNSRQIGPDRIAVSEIGTDGVFSFVDRPDRAGRYRYDLVHVDDSGRETALGATEVSFAPSAPHALASLAQNAPNPFNPRTVIEFTIDRASDARLSFYDARGRLQDRVEYARLSPGTHRHVLEAAGWPSGTYFYVLQAGDRTLSRRMTLVR